MSQLLLCCFGLHKQSTDAQKACRPVSIGTSIEAQGLETGVQEEAFGPLVPLEDTQDDASTLSPFRSIACIYPDRLVGEEELCIAADTDANPLHMHPVKKHSPSPHDHTASNPLANDHLERHLLPAGIDISSLQHLLGSATTTSHESAGSAGLCKVYSTAPQLQQQHQQQQPSAQQCAPLTGDRSTTSGRLPTTPEHAQGSVGDSVPELRSMSCEQLVRLCCPEELMGDMSGVNVIGHGSGSVVCQALWRGARVAVKFTSAASLHSSSSAVIRQALVSKALAHPNVLQHYSVRCCRLAPPASPPPTSPPAPCPPPPCNETDAGGSTTPQSNALPLPAAPTPVESAMVAIAAAFTAETTQTVDASPGPVHDDVTIRAMASNSAPASAAVNATAAPDVSLCHLSAEASTVCGDAGPSGQGLVCDLAPCAAIEKREAARSPLGLGPASLSRRLISERDQVLSELGSRCGLHHLVAAGGGGRSRAGAEPAGTGPEPDTRNTQASSTRQAKVASRRGMAVPAADAGSAGSARPSNPGVPGPLAAVAASYATALSGTLSFNSHEGFGNPFGSLRHALSLPHVAALVSAREGDYLTAIIMEHADKSTLQAALQRGLFVAGRMWEARVALRAALRTSLEVACALQHLHSRSVVHGALRPGNVLLKSSVLDRRGFTAKVTNFSLARVCCGDFVDPVGGLPALASADAAGTSHGPSRSESGGGSSGPCGAGGGDAGEIEPWSTASAATLAALPFWAPEQLRGAVGKPSDVYAFGVLLYVIFTGTMPYSGVPAASVAGGVADGSLRPVWPEGAELPPRVRELCGCCWEADPRVRPTFEHICASLKAIEQDVRKQQRTAAATTVVAATAQVPCK